MNPPYNTQPIF